MSSESKICQNCKKSFVIEPEDFLFYEKMKVPPPTFCPECRMIRRMVFYNEHNLFRQKDAATGRDLFSNIHPQSGVKVYERDYWWSDAWDPMEYGREYDFSQPFFGQFKELLMEVPRPNRNMHELINSDYADHAGYLKNCYLCFDIGDAENAAYVTRAQYVKDSLDLYEAFHTELSYENYMADEAYRVLFSVNCENSSDIWFSRNLSGCSNCFGCINLRGKSYYIFNEPHTKESYEKFMLEFNSGSYTVVGQMRERVVEFWRKHPVKFTLSINVQNSTGEHIERSKNLKYCYSVHEGENLAYSQLVDPPSTDCYDVTSGFRNTSLAYDTFCTGLDSAQVKFSWQSWLSVSEIEYSAFCHSSSNLFGCVGLKKKQYCIFNKQYTKEDFFALREKIIAHMNEVPYIDSLDRVYTYGEFFPPQFSPHAYNETIAYDFFPLTKEAAEKQGFLWRDPEDKEYTVTIKASELPDSITDVGDDILNAIIGCAGCARAYRIIQMELNFYRQQQLPLPRLCHDCRFRARLQFVNPPQWRHAKCHCTGTGDDRNIYQNQDTHFHGTDHCPNEFQTSYAPDRPEIIYCEQCYQAEVA